MKKKSESFNEGASKVQQKQEVNLVEALKIKINTGNNGSNTI
jgi:hypothetical protein